MQDFKESFFSVGLPLLSALGVGLFTFAFTSTDDEFPMLTSNVELEDAQESSGKIISEKDIMTKEEAQCLIDTLKDSILLKFDEDFEKTPAWSTELINDVKALKSEISSMKAELNEYKESNTLLLNKLQKKIQNINLNQVSQRKFDVALQKDIILTSILLFAYQFSSENKSSENTEEVIENEETKPQGETPEATLLMNLQESLKKAGSKENFVPKENDDDSSTSTATNYFTTFNSSQTSKLNAGIDNILMYIRNVLKQDDKFLTISTNNTIYKTTLKNLKNFENILNSIGFKYFESSKTWKFMWKESFQNKKRDDDSDEPSEENKDIIPTDFEEIKDLLTFCSTNLTNLKKSRDEFLLGLNFIKIDKETS